MSVLNDINVTDGAAIRALSSDLSSHDALRLFDCIRNFDCSRMDVAEMSIDPDWDTNYVTSIANAHWTDDDGRYCWGNATGTWKEYIDRIKRNPKFWSQGKYMPTTAVDLPEETARDLLSATYFFPFAVADKHANPIVRHCILPILETTKPKNVTMGSHAVYSLVHMAMQGSGGVLDRFSKSTDEIPSFTEFNDYCNLWSIGTSTNTHDVYEGMDRANNIDWELANSGNIYLNLAGLANYVLSWMNRAGDKGTTMKAARRVATKVKIQAYAAQHNENLRNKYAHDGEEARVAKEFRSGYSRLVAKLGKDNRVALIAASNIALLRIDKLVYLLTREDLLSVKFAAMSHSMWFMYAGSIHVEYAATQHIDLAAGPDDNTVRVGRELARDMEGIVKQLSSLFGGVRKQDVVPYAVVKEGLLELWDLYARTVQIALHNKRQDYLGRYLNECFSIFIAQQGGDLMAATIRDSLEEIYEEYEPMGFTPVSDISELLDICHKLPTSATHDFARLAKIVPAYDVNPIYSFLDRASKMQKPNPIGKAKLTGDFTVEISDMNAQEKKDAENVYRCACRVLLACSDVRQRAMDSLPDDEREAARDDPYPAVLARLRRLHLEVSTAVTYNATPDIEVPSANRTAASAQALALLRDGRQPDEPYAGAYLRTDNIVSYVERGDPDLSILKATAIVPGNINLAMSNISGIPRATPTRKHDGLREKGGGTMITDYLLDNFPSRREALAFVAVETCVASTSDKIETIKYPKKTRLITSMCAEGRRLQGEYEFNNGKVLINVPGFMIGVNPADRLKRTYAAIRQDTAPGNIRLYGSLDLSSFSAGMHWDVQTWTNRELFCAYGVDKSYQNAIEKCTLGSYMIRTEGNLRLFTVNALGSNYEGLDGKKNTFMHCALWYLARCRAYKRGLSGEMRAFIYIDDGAFSIEVEEDNLASAVKVLRGAMVQVYTEYGFKINLTKTVISTSYMQFLNEIYQHGIHIGYGFRALCHTAAQSFPPAATIAEELGVIVGGIRGAGVAGGQSLRLQIGFNYILWLYIAGVVGNKGRSLAIQDPYALTTALYLPTIAGGFGLPNWTSLFSNLSGNRDVEKADRVATMARIVRKLYPERFDAFRIYVKDHMLALRIAKPDFIPDRITIAHSETARLGDLGRDVDIAKAALDMSRNDNASVLLKQYITTRGAPTSGSIAHAMANAMSKAPVNLPAVFIDKALSTDPNAAIVTMVAKISSSFLVTRLLPRSTIRAYDRKYRNAGIKLMRNALNRLI